MSAAYLNEMEESELKLAYWKQKWEIAKEILETKNKNGTLTQAEGKIIEDLKSFTKREDREKLLKYLREKNRRIN